VAATQDAEIAITTIAYGTADGVVVADGRRYEVPVDEPVLAELAEDTGGRAYTAATGEELEAVYASIRGRLVTSQEEQDVSAWAAGAALLLLTGAAVPTLLRARLG
jgi:Ca-activated chloride channel family protein